MVFSHQPVLLEETVSLLKPGGGKLIADATLGGGGHAEALLEKGVQLIGVDKDPRALDSARHRLERFGSRFRAVQGDFRELSSILAREKALPLDGLLLDLGVSSAQLADPTRGFSFQLEGPLDMRMGNGGPTAAELIASLHEIELADLIRRFGEEPFARSIAKSLKRTLPKTTGEAAEEVRRAVPRRAWPKKLHLATRTFQALRIAVNRELEALDAVLASLPGLLKPGGVAAVISFHSLEDRRVKKAFSELSGLCRCPPQLPVCVCGAQSTFSILTKKAVVASPSEVERNPRSRSARLRAAEKRQ